jgi:hypothetical protein
MINTLPKPVLIALLYRLTILQLASRILPTIGGDSWDSEEGVDDGWADRPVSLDTYFCELFLKEISADVNAHSYAPDLSAINFYHSLLPSPL